MVKVTFDDFPAEGISVSTNTETNQYITNENGQTYLPVFRPDIRSMEVIATDCEAHTASTVHFFQKKS